MDNKLTRCLNDIAQKYDIDGVDAFGELLESNDDILIHVINAADSITGWISFQKATYDGNYCIETESGEYEVYYKERGRVYDPVEKFTVKAHAVATVIAWAGYLKYVESSSND